MTATPAALSTATVAQAILAAVQQNRYSHGKEFLHRVMRGPSHLLPGEGVFGAPTPMTTVEIQRMADDRRRLERIQQAKPPPAFIVGEDGLFPFAC